MACHLGEMSWKFHVNETKILLFSFRLCKICFIYYYFFCFFGLLRFCSRSRHIFRCSCCCFIFVFINFSFCMSMFCAFDMCLQFAWGEFGFGGSIACLCAKIGTNMACVCVQDLFGYNVWWLILCARKVFTLCD